MTQDSYASRLHWVGIATLVVLIGALGWVGWSLRPASCGYPDIPSSLQLYVPQSVGSSHYAMSLTHTGDNGAELKVTGPSLPDRQRWTLLVNNLGPGRLCTPSGDIALQAGGALATM